MELGVRASLAPPGGASVPIWHLAVHAAGNRRAPAMARAWGRIMYQYYYRRPDSTLNMKKLVRVFSQVNLYFVR
jgi:hypothetical protein